MAPLRQPATVYHYQSTGSRRPAALLAAIALAVGLIIPAADLRLLAFIFALPALFWLFREWRRQRTGLTLTADALELQHPFGLRPQKIPYMLIGGIIPQKTDRLGIAYYVPRPDFEGEPDPRPPRLRLTLTAPLTHLDDLIADLAHRLDNSRDTATTRTLPVDEVKRRFYMRRFRHRAFGIALFLATPLLTILAARLIFTLINSWRLLR